MILPPILKIICRREWFFSRHHGYGCKDDLLTKARLEEVTEVSVYRWMTN